MQILAVIGGVVAGFIVEFLSRAAGCKVTIGFDLTACALAASAITCAMCNKQRKF